MFSAILLAACGGDSSSGPAPEKTPESSSATLSSSDEGLASAVSSSSATVGNESSCSANVTAASSSSFESCSSGSVKGSMPANYDAATNTVTDERDGKKYKTVTIGSQTWFAQNLAYDMFGEYDDPFYRCPNKEDENCVIYGNLYDLWGLLDMNGKLFSYPAIVESNRPYKGACPNGWHIPSLDEWQVLLDNVPVQDLIVESMGGTSKSGFDIHLVGGVAEDGPILYGKIAMMASIDARDSQHMYYAKFTASLYVETAVASTGGDYISLRCLIH